MVILEQPGNVQQPGAIYGGHVLFAIDELDFAASLTHDNNRKTDSHPVQKPARDGDYRLDELIAHQELTVGLALRPVQSIERNRDNRTPTRRQQTRRTSGKHPVGGRQAQLGKVFEALGKHLSHHRDVDGARLYSKRWDENNAIIPLRIRGKDTLRHHLGPDPCYVADDICQRGELCIVRIANNREAFIASRGVPQ